MVGCLGRARRDRPDSCRHAPRRGNYPALDSPRGAGGSIPFDDYVFQDIRDHVFLTFVLLFRGLAGPELRPRPRLHIPQIRFLPCLLGMSREKRLGEKIPAAGMTHARHDPHLLRHRCIRIFPLLSLGNSFQRARRAFGELSLLFGSNCGASSLSTFGSRAQFDPASTPSFVLHSLYAFSPSSSCAISPVFRSPRSQSFAYPPLFPSSIIFVYSSIEPAYCSAFRARTNSALPDGSQPSNWVIVVSVTISPSLLIPKSSSLAITPGKPSISIL